MAEPLAIVTGGAGLAVGLLSIIGTAVNKKMMLKAEKHEKIKMLAGAKLNTINDHISKALKEEKISDEEYSLILSESAKFEQMKEEIRSKIKVEMERKQSKISSIWDVRKQLTIFKACTVLANCHRGKA